MPGIASRAAPRGSGIAATRAIAARSAAMSSLAPSHASPADPAPRIAVILMAVLQILTPMLPSLGIGEPIGSQSDEVRTLITPAGWAFSIWGPLYLGSMLFAIYQALPRQRRDSLVAQLRWPAAGAFLGNAVWAAYTQIAGLTVISVAIIACTLLCLLTAYRRISDWRPRFTTGQRWLAVLPLSALAAWLTAATIVNIAAALRFHGVEVENGAVVTAPVVLVGGVIAAAALFRGWGNPPYAIVFLWALAAIYASGGQQAGLVAASTAVAALLVVAGALLGIRRAGASRWFG